MRNNRGPSIHPWGTPAETLDNDDDESLMTTFCFLS